MTKNTVQHFVSLEAEHHIITRARIVHSSSRTDDVALFMGDTIVCNMSVPAGKGEALCEQLQLIDRAHAAEARCSFDDIARQFGRACRE